jgi:hypothetical protein
MGAGQIILGEKMKKLCLLSLLVCGCGSAVYEDHSDPSRSIESGSYRVTMKKFAGDCNYLPENQTETWTFFNDEDDLLVVYVDDLRMESSDGSYFYGSTFIENGLCDIFIKAYSTILKNDTGFVGDVMLAVDVGICGGCVDRATLNATKM